MINILDKPSPEAKALSLFLMAFKNTSQEYKGKYKHIKKQWGNVLNKELSTEAYTKEVNDTLESYGGYTEVIKKTVQFYLDKSGEWSLKGDDQYCVDAQKIANELQSEAGSE